MTVMYDSWQEWRRLRGWRLVRRELPYGIWGLTDFNVRTVTLAPGMTHAEERCTLTHELFHVERGPVGADEVADEERVIELLTAGRLISAADLRDLAARHSEVGEMALAKALEVDEIVLRAGLQLAAVITAAPAHLELTA